MSKSNSRIENITPTKARKMLDGNGSNRPLNEAYVLELAEVIENDEWQLNGESIKIDVNDDLKDGQHRLEAVVIAGKAIETYVTRGVPVDCFGTIDRGTIRTNGHLLHINGENNCNTLAAALTWMHKYELGKMRATGRKGQPRTTKLFEILSKHPGIRDSIIPGRLTKRLLPVSVGVFCHYQFALRDREAADKLFSGVASGENLRKTQAAYRLREILLDNRGSKGKRRSIELCALTIKAWNASRSGDRVKILRWTTEGSTAEPFPQIAD